MCGVAAAFGPPDAVRQTLRRVLRRLEHRGHPDTLYEIEPAAGPGIGLGTNRLPIVDEARNRQPAVSPAGRFMVAMNGEVFNFPALAADLTAAGVTVPEPNSDTSVLAAALEQWGVARTLARLNWEGVLLSADRRTGHLIAIRDHLGIKPLYWTDTPAGPVFASEIKGLTVVGAGVIQPVPPGAVAHVTRDGAVHIERYWTLDDVVAEPTAGTVGEQIGILRELLVDAVRVRVPDRPFAVALSGGVDSAMVLRAAVSTRVPCTAYTLHRNGSVDLPYARGLCQELGVPLVEVLAPEPDELCDELAETVQHVETWEWHVLNHAAPMRALTRAIHADGHRVVLSGEGADELFAGYSDPDSPPPVAGDLVREQRRRLADLHRTNCRRLDRVGMADSLEFRVPFLDRRVVEFALHTPVELFRRDGHVKWILRMASAPLVGSRIALRRKMSMAKGAGYPYGPGFEAAGVFGPITAAEPVTVGAEEWAALPRFALEHTTLGMFLGQGYGRAEYLRSRSL